jgi:two-component system, OmpR family, sensor kinase
MSIRTRLTLWYTGLLAIALLVFGALLYSLLSSVLVSVLDDRLANQARNVITVIQAENDPVSVMLSGHARLPPIDVFASQYYVQIVNIDGQPVQQSDNLQGRALPLSQEMISTVRSGRSGNYTLDLGQGVRLRVYYTPIIFAQHPIGAVQIGQSLSNMEEALAVIRSTMLLGSITALLLAAVGGVILARAALRPIQYISATARQITMAEDLGRRIPISVPNDELGQLTNTINDMLARLETLFQTQQRLVADVSHELRTPLTTIRGNLDLLRRGAVDDPIMRAEALSAIEDETGRMSRLVNDLLLLAQADAGLKLHFEPVELDTLVLEVYRQAQVMAQGNLAVRLGAEDQALVLGDADRLRQLLLNLVDNAIKYTPNGGQITLTLKKESGWVEVAVHDTGIGIAEQDLPHIFERFYRADPSRGRPGGSGLGLSIAHWIAEAHGGRLEASSVPGQGSTFRLGLPLADTDAAPVIMDEDPEFAIA